MEGIKSSVVLFALLLAIFGPTVSFGNKRTCFCETWIRPTGASSDGSSDIRLLDITNPVYRRTLYLGCSGPRSWCPRDCKQRALETLGGSRSTFTREAGNRVCSIYQGGLETLGGRRSTFTREAGNRVCLIYGYEESFQCMSVMAKYDVSNCGTSETIFLTERVCCT